MGVRFWLPTLLRGRICGLYAALFLFAAAGARAQLLQGTITGNVTDSSQAAVVGATVSAQNEGTTFTRDTVTNSDGDYTLATLPPGSYTVTS